MPSASEPGVETTPRLERPQRSRHIRLFAGAVVVVIVVLAIGQFTGWFQSYHEITTGIGTFVTEVTISGQTTTTSVVVPSESIKGKFPTGQQMYVSFTWSRGPYTTATVTGIEITTPGFIIQQVTPSLPIAAPSTGNIEVRIYIKTPNQIYNGPLDYTIYVRATQ